MAGEVVRALDALDPEAPVLAAARLAVLEDDHAADRLGALEVRDVVALDAHRRSGQAEGLGQLLERGQRLALVGEPARLLARQRLAGVPRRERHELTALPALRDVEADMAPALLRGTPRCRRRPAAVERHVDLARDGARARVVLLDEAAEHLLVGRLADGVQQEHVAPDHLAVADGEQLDRGLAVLARHPERSSSVRANAAIFWLSIVRSMARILSRRRRARSYSVWSAAAAISRRSARTTSPGDPRGTARPARCRPGSRP